MNFAEKVLQFNQSLFLDNSLLPQGIEVMNPFRNPEIGRITGNFYRKFFSDERKRHLIIGINPGRFGGGVTGIPFTDPHKLKNDCGITIGKLTAPELSADFVYKVIAAFGGAEKFYGQFFVSAICPLGFVKKLNGKETNYNYYDSRELQTAVSGFILETLRKQIEFGIHRDVCFCLGTGKNFDYLSKLNSEHHFFKTIVPLDHPRFIMQYRRKKIDEYVEKYLEALGKCL
ncbi:MAG TPA: uracil-DNA glycosylase family protein [Bacteroidales bacterium]